MKRLFNDHLILFCLLIFALFSWTASQAQTENSGQNSTVDVNDLIFGKRTLVPCFAEPAIKFPTSIRLLEKGLMPWRKLVTHTFGFEDYQGIFRGIAEGSEAIIKAVLTPHG